MILFHFPIGLSKLSINTPLCREFPTSPADESGSPNQNRALTSHACTLSYWRMPLFPFPASRTRNLLPPVMDVLYCLLWVTFFVACLAAATPTLNKFHRPCSRNLRHSISHSDATRFVGKYTYTSFVATGSMFNIHLPQPFLPVPGLAHDNYTPLVK